MNLFTRHPATVGETYLEHLAVAGRFAVQLLLAAGACAVHAVLPFLFERSASSRVEGLHRSMGAGRGRRR